MSKCDWHIIAAACGKSLICIGSDNIHDCALPRIFSERDIFQCKLRHASDELTAKGSFAVSWQHDYRLPMLFLCVINVTHVFKLTSPGANKAPPARKSDASLNSGPIYGNMYRYRMGLATNSSFAGQVYDAKLQNMRQCKSFTTTKTGI